MRTTLALLALILGLSLAGCGSSEEESGGGGGIERTDIATLVKVYTKDKVETLDPHATSNGGDTKVINQLFETLVRIDLEDASKVMPALAESWEVSKDSKTITFKIREGVKFHDGSELTAGAVKTSLDRVRGGLESSKYKAQYMTITDISADGQELKITSSIAAPGTMLKNLTMFSASIVSEKSLTSASEMAKNPVGTGPFKFVSFPGDNTVTLEAFDGYWDGAPSIKTLVFSQSKDDKARLATLDGDKPTLVDEVARTEWERLGDKMKMWWGLNTCYLGVNTKSSGALSNFKIRKAIQLALDHEAIAALYKNTAKANYNLLSTTSAFPNPDFRPDGWDKDRETRLARAKKLVTESGLSGSALEIRLQHPQDARPYLGKPQESAELIKRQLAEIGLTVKPEATVNGVLFDSFPKEEHELVLIGWMSDNGDPDNFFAPLTGSHEKDGKLFGNNNNVGRTADKMVNERISKATLLPNFKERQKAYQSLEAYQQNTLIGYVPLVTAKQAIAYTDKLEGVEIDPLGHYRFHKAKIVE